MHELSIAQNLLALCEKNAQENNATKITKIHIKIGRLSGVEAHYLQSAFSVLQPESVCEDAELVCHTQEVIVECDKCGFNGELVKNEFICPQCKSTNIKVTDGEDMYLMRLEMQ
ncbi:hydrogenase maturation nickel metallochaperone HypA [Campylobacter majalis]|uniref:hydrogenase maturation nickel metallochaperone HypA n=1 Tax=Campylobacter majalis TaxID=2790656 RepID=UPI003D6892C9